MALDPQTQIDALTATIARQTLILDSGVTQTLENGRMVRIDLDTVRDQMNANVAALATLTLQPRQVRRLLPVQRSKGL